MRPGSRRQVRHLGELRRGAPGADPCRRQRRPFPTRRPSCSLPFRRSRRPTKSRHLPNPMCRRGRTARRARPAAARAARRLHSARCVHAARAARCAGRAAASRGTARERAACRRSCCARGAAIRHSSRARVGGILCPRARHWEYDQESHEPKTKPRASRKHRSKAHRRNLTSSTVRVLAFFARSYHLLIETPFQSFRTSGTAVFYEIFFAHPGMDECASPRLRPFHRLRSVGVRHGYSG